MRRRQFLPAIATLSSISLSGCLGDLTTVRLDWSEKAVRDGRRANFVWDDDGRERAAGVSLWLPRLDENDPKPESFRLDLWHAERLNLDAFEFRFRAPPTGPGVPAYVYLRQPSGGPWPDFRFEYANDLTTVFAADELGKVGSGSLGFDLLLDPSESPPRQLSVGVRLELSPGVNFVDIDEVGRTFVAERHAILDLPEPSSGRAGTNESTAPPQDSPVSRTTK